jgi:hypothetical protein
MTLKFHTLKEHDPVMSINICNWFLWYVHDGKVQVQTVIAQSKCLQVETILPALAEGVKIFV